MKKEIKLSNAIGKTLEGYCFSITCGQAVLSFTDGTFSTLGIGAGYEYGDETIEEDELELLEFGDEALINLDITTMNEIDKKREQDSEKFNDSKNERDKIEYERLKRKFES